MASPVHPTAPCPEASGPERPPPVASLTDDLLEEILLRAASPGDLARASAACASLRRLATDARFLRRYRSLHPPLLLGFFTVQGFEPVAAPHRDAALGRAFARAADASLDSLPLADWRRWHLRDARDGRLLILFVRLADYDYGTSLPAVLGSLVVCDPLSRRHLLLPPLPDSLLASVELSRPDVFNSEAFLVPCGDGEGEETSFRVICVTFDETRLVAFVFSSASGRWSVGASTNWDALRLEEPEHADVLDSRNYAYGCFYWKVCHWDKLLKLDMNKMEFSADDLPPEHAARSVAIVEAGEGELGMFSLTDQGMSVDYHTYSQDGGERANGWRLKNTIPLPAHDTCCIGRALEGHLFLPATRKVRDMVHSVCFALDIKTFDVETISVRRRNFGFIHPYFSFPPSMSPTRIQRYDTD